MAPWRTSSAALPAVSGRLQFSAWAAGETPAGQPPGRRRYDKQLLFERLVYGLAVLGGQRNLLCLLTQLFLHKRQRVVARRQALDLVLAVGPGYRKERRLHHVDIHLHPGMLVTL